MPWEETRQNGYPPSSMATEKGVITDAPNAPNGPSIHTTELPEQESSPSTINPTEPFSGSATTATSQAAGIPISQEHAARLRERGLNPVLAAQLGLRTINRGTLGIEYRRNGEVHNVKLRRGKGNMPWQISGKPLIAWNVDSCAADVAPDEQLIITEGEFDAIACIQAGYSRVVSVPNGAQRGESGFEWLYLANNDLRPEFAKFPGYVLATDSDAPGVAARDALATRLGDAKCEWVKYPAGCKDCNDVLRLRGVDALRECIESARPMWTDEIACLSDIPDPPENEPRYRFGIPELDTHGLRITLPCLWVITGPYSSGKSVLLRQLLINFWRIHRWRCLMSAFEERVKPRFQRDLRRLLIGRPRLPDAPWSAEECAAADEEIEEGFRFIQRPPRLPLVPAHLLKRIEFAAKRHAVKCVAIDPINEVDLRPPPGQLKTDLIGDFLLDLKDLADDYKLLIVVVCHMGKHVLLERGKRLLNMSDGEDTRHWGNRSDIGWAMWRPSPGKPTLLNVDRTKDHESMGRPVLAELALDRSMNRFSVTRLGYDILGNQ